MIYRKKIKIALLCNYPPHFFVKKLGLDISRLKRFTSWNHTLVSELCNYSNMEVYVITKGDILRKTKIIRNNKLTVIYLGAPKILNGITLHHNLVSMSKKILDEIKPDVVHGIGIEHIWAYTAISSNFPSVITVHGIPSQIAKKLNSPLFSRIRYFANFEKKVLGKTKNFISISPYVEKCLGPLINARIYFIENPISKIYHNIQAEPDKRNTILFVGDTGRRKALGTLLHAFSVIAKSEHARDWFINIVGPTGNGKYYYKSIKKILDKQGLTDRIHFKGFLLPDRLANEYSRAAFLVSSSIEETAPMCIGEAMSAGLPVIASRISGVPYMVDEGKSGFLFQANNHDELMNKMNILVGNPKLRREMGTVGKRIAEHRWRPEVIAQKTIDVYLKVLESEA